MHSTRSLTRNGRVDIIPPTVQRCDRKATVVKRCTSCGELKAKTSFDANPRTADRLASHCKLCVVERLRKRNLERREALIELFGGCCEICGEDGFDRLQFHHVHPVQKNKDIAGMLGKFDGETMDDELADELNLVELLCTRCHGKRHRHGVPQLYEFTPQI